MENVSSPKKFINFNSPIKWEYGKRYTAPSDGFVFINSDGVFLTQGVWLYHINDMTFKLLAVSQVHNGVCAYQWMPISRGDVFEMKIAENGGYLLGPQYFYPIG